MSDKLAEIRKAIDMFDTEQARKLLGVELQNDPTAETYYLASLVALDDAQQINFFETNTQP